jgi:thiol-disulfide isomerase/thioredoxin
MEREIQRERIRAGFEPYRAIGVTPGFSFKTTSKGGRRGSRFYPHPPSSSNPARTESKLNGTSQARRDFRPTAYTPNAERRTPNAERRTPNAERRTPNAKRRAPIAGIIGVWHCSNDTELRSALMIRNFYLSTVLAVAGILWFAGPLYQARAAATAAPEWQLNDPDGKAVKLSDFKGKVVILDFWATWCPPCRAEIPGFISLQKQYAAQGLTVVGVSLDTDGASVVKSFMKRVGMNYPVVIGDEKIASNYGGITAIPTTFVLDRNGNIVTSHQGYASQVVFESEIRPLLEQK